MKRSRRTLRAAEGRRHSASDQGHVDQARAHAAAALGHLDDLGADASTKADLADAKEVEARDVPPGHGSPTAAERYKIDLAARFAEMRIATRQIERENAVARKLPAVRQLEAASDIPNAFSKFEQAPTIKDFTLSDLAEHYDPYGTPPDGYRVGLAFRAAKAEFIKEQA
jgi:hypothetical protein